jgi:predicted ATPase
VALWAIARRRPESVAHALLWGLPVFLAGALIILAASYIRLRRRLRRHPEAPRQTGPVQATAVPAAPTPTTTAPRAAAEIPEVPPVDLLAREEELALISQFIRGTEPRYLTLWGTGGIGKSALARAALWEARAEGTRTAFVALQKACDVDDFLVLVVQQLEINLVAGQAPADGVMAFLRWIDEPTVLVLDNLDRIAEAVAPLLDKWAVNCLSVRLIVTSRQELFGDREHKLEVKTLEYPSAESEPDGRTEAERLFIKRAQLRDARFPRTARDRHLVGKICQAVEGLPLGIKLAAGFIGRLSLAEILRDIGKLESASPGVEQRHKSLDSLIDWSTDSLSAAPRQLLRQLCVVGGKFDARAAAAIASLPGGSPDPLDLLTMLVDASLLERTEEGDTSYYRMREEIRQRCLRYLEASQDPPVAEVQDRYDRFYTGRAEAARATADGPDMRAGLDQLQADYEALLDIMRRNIEADPVTAARIVVCLNWLASYRRPGEKRVPRLREIAGRLDRTPYAPLGLRVKVAVELAIAYTDLGLGKGESTFLAHAEEWCARAVELAGDAEDDSLLATALHWQGWLDWRSQPGQPGEGFAEAARLWRRSRDWVNAADAVALSSLTLPQPDRLARVDEAERLLGERDVPRVRFRIQLLRSENFVIAGRLAEAERASQELTDIADRVVVPAWQETALHVRGNVLSELGRYDEAAEAFRQLEAIYQRREAWALVAMALASQGAALIRRQVATTEQLRDALAPMDQGISLIEQMDLPPVDTVPHYNNRSWALQRLNMLPEAIEDSDRVAPLLSVFADSYSIGGFVAQVIRARVLDAAGRDTEAESAALRGWQMAQQLGYSIDSLAPNIREHMQWLTGYLAGKDAATAPGPAGPGRPGPPPSPPGDSAPREH